MTTALQAVDWPGFYADLIGRASPETVTAALWHAEHAGPHLPPEPFALAILIQDASPATVDWLLADHVTDDPDGLLVQRLQSGPAPTGRLGELGGWLRLVGRVVLRISTGQGDPIPERPPALGGLLVDELLQPLPHLELAREHATVTGGLLVLARQLPPGDTGRHSPGLIELDPDQAGGRLHAVWRHELAHALDPDPLRGPELRELFADRLAELLAEHDPASLADLQPLLDAAAAAALPEPAPDDDGDGQGEPLLPPLGHQSLWAFLYLPLRGQPAEVPG
jgi:hypothetical protein